MSNAAQLREHLFGEMDPEIRRELFRLLPELDEVLDGPHLNPAVTGDAVEVFEASKEWSQSCQP